MLNRRTPVKVSIHSGRGSFKRYSNLKSLCNAYLWTNGNFQPMKAIEIGGQIDTNGFVRIDTPLSVSNKRVKVIILMPEDDEIDDESWLQSMASNSACLLYTSPSPRDIR